MEVNPRPPQIDINDGPAHEGGPVMDLFLVDSKGLDQSEIDYWKQVGLNFFIRLSNKSFQLRFGHPKPEETEDLEEIVDYFVWKSRHPHKILALMHDDKLMGACSIFDYTLLIPPNRELVATDNIAEFSITVADQMQGKGIGSWLLEKATIFASEHGKDYAYFSFDAGNERSRRLVRDVCGSSNIVAGRKNPRDKFYRLPNPPGNEPRALDEQLEYDMRLFCGDEEVAKDVAQDDGPLFSKRKALIARLSLNRVREL